jgi:hypothetical protein
MAQINLDTLPRSRKEALALGSTHYFTGKPCKRGHLATRLTCNTDCRECKRGRDRAETLKQWAPRGIQCLACGAAMLTQLKPGQPSQFCTDECRALTYRKYRRRWEKANPEARKQQVRKRLKAHREQRTDIHLSTVRRQCAYQWKRRRRDVDYRLRLTLRNRLCAAISRGKGKKIESSISLVGCTVFELRAHLESQFQPGMTWDNYGLHGWHIDHIIPCASFDLTDPEQQKACFHYTNLQPLWAEDNLKKGARLAA